VEAWIRSAPRFPADSCQLDRRGHVGHSVAFFLFSESIGAKQLALVAVESPKLRRSKAAVISLYFDGGEDRILRLLSIQTFDV
jgi:hypothetical protein